MLEKRTGGGPYSRGPHRKAHFLPLSHHSLGAALSPHAGDRDRERKTNNIQGMDKDWRQKEQKMKRSAEQKWRDEEVQTERREARSPERIHAGLCTLI